MCSAKGIMDALADYGGSSSSDSGDEGIYDRNKDATSAMFIKAGENSVVSDFQCTRAKFPLQSSVLAVEPSQDLSSNVQCTSSQSPPSQSSVSKVTQVSSKIKPTCGAYVSKRKHSLPTDAAGSVTAATSSDISSLLQGSDCDKKRSKLGSSIPKVCKKLPREHSKPVMSLDWHGSNSSLFLSCSLDGTSRLWDSAKQIHRFSLHSGAAVSCGRWVTSSTIATGGYDKYLVLADVEKNDVIASFVHKDYVSALHVHPFDKNLIFSGDYGGNIFSWDQRTGKNVKEYRGAGGRILDMTILQSANELLASSDIVCKNTSSHSLRVWQVDSAVAISHQIYPEPYTCPCVHVHPFKNEFYAQSNANYIVIFSSRKPYKCNKYKRFESHTVYGNRVEFDISPDGRLLCSASADGRVVFYDCDTVRPLKTLHVSDNCCVAVAWNHHESSMVAVSDWSGDITIVR